MVGNDNWWRTHGISCTSVSGDGSGGPWNGTESNQWEEFGDTCVLPYTVIETVHAAIFMFLTVTRKHKSIDFVCLLLLLNIPVGDNLCTFFGFAVFS